MAISTPLFQIDDVVYVIVSAAGRGFLEPYRIDGLSYDKTRGQWIYAINVAKAPGPGVIVGDQIQLQRERILYFTEAELTDYCTALQLCENYLLQQLAGIQSKISGNQCGGTA